MSGASLDVKFSGSTLTIKGCLPHYRRPIAEIIEIRERIHARLLEARVPLPIKNRKIHLRVVAKKHADGGDLSNILQAVVQAVDGNTLGKDTAILSDDKLIEFISARWIP